MLFLKMPSIDWLLWIPVSDVSGSKVWMVSAELSFYMWYFSARKVTPNTFLLLPVCNTGAWVETAAKRLSSEPSQKRRRSDRARHGNKFRKLKRLYQPPHLPVWACDCRCRAVEQRCGVYQQRRGWGLPRLKRAKCRGKQSRVQTARHAPAKKSKAMFNPGM